MIYPLPVSEERNEIITLVDGSTIEINQQMRVDCSDVYVGTCRKAVSRQMVETNGETKEKTTMKNEQSTEQMIQDKGLTAPRLRPEDIVDAKIIGSTFTKLPSGKCMICEITLANGFTVRGEAACVSPENFDEEIGRKVSLENAVDKIWPLEGYLLQEKHPVVPVKVVDAVTNEEYEDWQKRVIEERDQLNSKLAKLKMFIDTDQLHELPAEEAGRLLNQRDAMARYSAILDDRIAAFNCPF